MSRRSAIVIGAGIGGIATAGLLAKAGVQVDVYDKQSGAGGRAGKLEAEGFTFDTGPSWFLMPEIFEHYFKLFGADMDQLLDLRRLDPAYKVYFEDNFSPITIHGDLAADKKTFEGVEPGAGKALERYLKRAGKTYQAAVGSYLYNNFERFGDLLPSGSLAQLPQLARGAVQPVDRYVKHYFKDARLRQIMEYPMVFLGTSPFEAPAIYHLMSHMDFVQGVYYPMGGMYKVIEALRSVAEQAGVRFHFDSEVRMINTENGRATGVVLADGNLHQSDIVVSNADLYHTETALLPTADTRSYPEQYWQGRQAGPSALLMYLGVKGELPELAHHTLLFTKDWHANFSAIFHDKQWPQPASMYISRTSATDPSVAPAGHENLFVLVPMQADESVGPEDIEAKATAYLQQLADMVRVPDLPQRVVYRRLFGPQDFAAQFNSWRGSALGMSHRLTQSAMFRPGVRSKKLPNLYYVGGNTRPGVGLPMCLIGAELIYKQLAGEQGGRAIDRIRPLEAV